MEPFKFKLSSDLAPVALCRRRWCSTLGQTPTTFFISTTVWGRSCWTSTMDSLAFCSLFGARAKTFPWRLAHISLHTSWRLNWHFTELKNPPLYFSLDSRSNSPTVFFIALIFFAFPHQSPAWHLSPCASLPYRNIWSRYTQRSRIWSCRGSRKGLLTPSSLLLSDCCLPGGTSWPGRKMKAPGRKWKDSASAGFPLYSWCPVWSRQNFGINHVTCVCLTRPNRVSLVFLDTSCLLIWWSRYLRSSPSMWLRFLNSIWIHFVMFVVITSSAFLCFFLSAQRASRHHCLL